MAIQTFTSGQVLTAAQVNALQSNDFNQTVTTKTASYTPTTTTDIGTRVIMDSASATTITINTSIYTAGDTFFIGNIGVGVCTLTAGTCTITSAGPLAIPQNGGGTLYFTSASAAIFYSSAGPAASSALNFITSGTFSAVSQGSVTGCFSSTYTNYRIMINLTVADGDTYFIFGTSSTISSSASMRHHTIFTGSESVAATGTINQIYWRVARSITSNANIVLDIFNPNVAMPTSFNSSYGGNTSTLGVTGASGGNETTSNQYTDFTIRSDAHPSGSISFTYKVYGYSNS